MASSVPTGTAPALSIIVCTRNRADQLKGTLESLHRMPGSDWEAIIVDNSSTDDTAGVIHSAIARDPRLRYVLGSKIGLGAARNAGWREARAPLVSFTDDDCYVEADYARAMIAVFAEHPALGFIGGRVLLYDPDDLPVTIDTREAPANIPAFVFAEAGSVQGANFAFRKAVLDRIGGFDDGLGAGTPFPCEDIDAVAAALWSGSPGAFDPRPTVLHHHRRRAPDLPAILKSYDAGRGAYYLKYILRRDTRWPHIRAWTTCAVRKNSLISLVREISAGLHYVRARHGAPYAALAAAPLYGFFGGVLLAKVFRAALRGEARRR